MEVWFNGLPLEVESGADAGEYWIGGLPLNVHGASTGDQTVDPAFVTSTATLYPPIDVFDPALVQALSLSFYTNAPVAYTLALTPHATVLLPTITNTSVLRVPAVNTSGVATPNWSVTTTLYPPSLALGVVFVLAPPKITNTGAIYAMALAAVAAPDPGAIAVQADYWVVGV